MFCPIRAYWFTAGAADPSFFAISARAFFAAASSASMAFCESTSCWSLPDLLRLGAQILPGLIERRLGFRKLALQLVRAGLLIGCLVLRGLQVTE